MSANFESEDILYNLAYECEGLFDQLQEVLFQNTKSKFIELCVEFQQRFAIWAAHIGVFARKSQCLDTRLQNHPDLQDLVARLLDILRRSLQQCTIEVSNQGEENSVQTAALKTIDDTLTRLNRLGVTIRQSGRGKFDTRAKKFAAGLDLSSFASLCASAVQALYPGAHQSLKDYLSKSMTDRYASMLFLDSRHKKLETRRELCIGLSPIHEIPNNETQTNTAIAQLAKAIINPAVKSVSRPPTALSQSDLSSINVYQIRSRLRPPDEASTKFHKTSSIQVNQGNYPRPPVTNQGSSIFTCQWCSELLSKKTLSESEWRRHIDRDLKPYICLSEGCPEAHPVYPTFDEWFSHMELHDWRWHQQVYLTSSWVCTICDFNPDVYSSPQALYSHLEESHGSDFTNAQLQAISRQSKTEQPRASDDCLLCCFAVEEQGDNGDAVFPKRRKGQPKREASKSARKSLEMTNPSPHISDPEFSDTSSDSDDMGSQQHRKKRNKDRSKAVTRHVAVHLQVLMLLTLRFAAALQDDDGGLDDGTKSDSVDIDEGNSASEGTDLGRLSHIASEADVTMKDGQDGNDAKNTEGDMDVDEGIDIDIVEDDMPIPDTDLDLEFVPRQYDDLIAKNDEFLNKVIKSGAYQSWRDEPPKEFEVVVTPPPPGSDVVQVDADRYYRESIIAQKIASDKILFRKNSPDESVVNKWERQSADEVVTIVTPPDMEAKEEYKSPFDPPNADAKIDNEIYPDDIHRFRAAQGAADEPMFKSRDQSCERDRPVLNLVRPTPSASPAQGNNNKYMTEEETRKLIALQRNALYGEGTFVDKGGYIDDTGNIPTIESNPDEERQSMEASGDSGDDYPIILDEISEFAEGSGMLPYLGENSDEPAEAEEDFSPHLRRVGHVEFDKIANPAERPPGPPPAAMRVSSRTIATVVDDDVEYFDMKDERGIIRHGYEKGVRKQKARDKDEGQRLAPFMVPWRRPSIIYDAPVDAEADANANANAENLTDSVRLPSSTEELLKDKAREQQQRAEEEMQRRGLARDEQRAEEQGKRRGLAELMLSRRHSTTTLETRRHGVVFDRWLERELDDNPPE